MRFDPYANEPLSDGPRPPHVSNPSVSPTEGMQVYAKQGGRRVGRIIGVEGANRVIVRWRDGAVSREAFGATTAPTTYMGT